MKYKPVFFLALASASTLQVHSQNMLVLNEAPNQVPHHTNASKPALPLSQALLQHPVEPAGQKDVSWQFGAGFVQKETKPEAGKLLAVNADSAAEVDKLHKTNKKTTLTIVQDFPKKPVDQAATSLNLV